MKQTYSSWLTRPLAALGLLLATAGAAQAQTPTFAPVATYDMGANPVGPVLADVNGDGFNDLLTANYNSATLGVRLGSSTGTLGALTTYPSNSQPLNVAVGDLNGDGRPDAVTANFSGNKIGVFINAGAGSFGAVTEYTAGSDPFWVALADFNGDGKLDAVTANNFTNSVGVLLGNGTGGFAAAVQYAAGSTPNSVAVGDVNGDGKPDVVVSNANGGVSVLVGSGSGTLSAAVAYSLGTNAARGVALGDLNRDGRLDIVAAGSSTSPVAVLLNTGASAFGSASLYAGSGSGNIIGVAVGDVNGDGFLDVAASRSNGGVVLVLAGTGTGTLGTATTYATDTSTPQDVAIGNINNDGKLDIVAGEGFSGGASRNAKVFLNTTTFAAPTLTTLSPNNGPVGTSVTLAGTNLGSATGVRFNGTVAAFTIVNATTLMATVPTGATTGPVTVTTSGGTSGGVAFTVTTAPTVATAAPTSITTTSAVLGGNATADGGVTITDRGVVYSVSSTNTAPTIGGTGVTQDANVSGTGAFSETISGLAPGTAYTVRAYATNSVGTSYGSSMSFTTVANTSVVSISRVGSSPTNASSVSYSVTFAAPVTGLSSSNFGLVTTGSVAGASLTSVSGVGTTYTVAVNTGTGDGTLGLNLTNAAGVSPGLSNALPFVGQAYTIDKMAPTVTITSPTAPNGGYTTTSPLTFVVTFSEVVMGYNFANIASNISNAASGSVDATAAPTYTVTLVPATAGAVTVSVPAGIVTDAAGNANVAAVPPTYTIYYNVPTAAPVLTTPANGVTLATTLPTYAGTAPAGSTVTVFVNNASVGTTTAPSGTFSFTQPTALAPGQYTVYATAQLSGQAVSANSNTNTFTVATAPTITLLSPATGPVGTQVTITGTNLTGTTAVRFNGTAASSFVVNSATSLTAIVAAGTTTGLVTVTTPGGTASSALPFVVRVAPVTVADAYTTPQNVTLTGNVLTNDLGTNPRAILINRPANGTLVLNPDGSFSYRPNAGFTGADSFTYYACDPALPLLCGNPATVSITVLRIAPVTVTDAYTTPQNTTLTGNVLSNDLGTNPRAILITRPTNGVLVLNPDGTFTYQPNAGYVGPDSFTYYACDPNLPLLCGNPATVSITVVRVAPITVADAYTTRQGVTLTGNVLTNDIGTNPRAILITRPTRGTLVLNPDGSFTYQPTAGFTGLDTFTYYACNQGSPLVCGDPATVTITVTPATNTRVAASPTATSASSTSPAATTAKPAAIAATGAVVRLELTLTGYPNPFRNELQLHFTLPIAQAYTLAVYDAQGRLVQQLASGQAEAGQAQELTVPTHTYATGLYLVRLTTATGTQQLKLIKQ